MKKDKYLRKRGGTAKIINVSCMKCGKLLFIYQKDGPGWLKRCYLNRILSPEKYEKIQHDKKIKTPKDLKNLKCTCGSTIGSPIKHKDNRLAFHLIRGKFKRTLNKSFK
tara:strand:+ start:2019 stop:2345 length:327 start_codon:yes stop_codon:yes gene_type:complete